MLSKVMRDERGVTLVLVALLLVVLLGAAALSVDVGRLYLERQHLVNACDAAALAGGIELQPNNLAASRIVATARADDAALSNNMPVHEVSFPSDTRLRVDGHQVVQHTFGRILGFASYRVDAYAIVERLQGLSQTSGIVVPWGIPSNDYQAGQEVTVKISQEDSEGGNFYPLALRRSYDTGGSGGAVYNEDIKYGYQGPVAVGDIVSTEPGNMVGPTHQAVVTDTDSLFNRAEEEPWASQTFETATYGNPRVVVVPIVSPMESGRDEVTILGFAAFYVTSCTGKEVTGQFIEYTVPTGSGGGPDYGVSVLRLVE